MDLQLVHIFSRNENRYTVRWEIVRTTLLKNLKKMLDKFFTLCYN